jgi:hypothetical protein
MHHCPSEETQRRLALDLLIRPPHRNRPRSRRRRHHLAMAAVAVCTSVIAMLWLAAHAL